METLKKYWALLPVIILHVFQYPWSKLAAGDFPAPKITIEGLEMTGIIGLMALFFAVFILAASEEFAFRGLGQWLMAKATKNKYLIVGVVATIFGLMHVFKGSGEYQVAYAIFFGIYFGALRLEGMSLLKLSLIHFVVNASSVLVTDDTMPFMTDNPLLITSIATLPVLLSGLHKLKKI